MTRFGESPLYVRPTVEQFIACRFHWFQIWARLHVERTAREINHMIADALERTDVCAEI